MEISLNTACFIYQISNFIIVNKNDINIDDDILAKLLIMEYSTEKCFDSMINFEDKEINKFNVENNIDTISDEEKFNKKIELDKLIFNKLEENYSIPDFDFFTFSEFKRLIYSVLKISQVLIIKDISYNNIALIDLIHKFLIKET